MEHLLSDEELYQRELQRENPFMQHNHIEIELVERDHAVLRLDVRPESKNPHGTVHGGMLWTMADNATAIAAHTDGRTYVTQNGSLYFLHNQSDGILRAEAIVQYRGKSTVLVDVRVSGTGGRVLANGTYSLFCIEQGRDA